MALPTEGAKAGDAVCFAVVYDVYGPGGALLIRTGALAPGHVIRPARRGLFGAHRPAEFSCDSVQAVDGTSVPIGRSFRAPDNSGPDGPTVYRGQFDVTHRGGQPNDTPDSRQYPQYPGTIIEVYPTNPVTVLAPDKGGVDPSVPIVAAVAKDTQVVPSPGPESGGQRAVIVLKDGRYLVATIVSFDGTRYTLDAGRGHQIFRAVDVASIRPLSR